MSQHTQKPKFKPGKSGAHEMQEARETLNENREQAEHNKAHMPLAQHSPHEIHGHAEQGIREKDVNQDRLTEGGYSGNNRGVVAAHPVSPLKQDEHANNTDMFLPTMPFLSEFPFVRHAAGEWMAMQLQFARMISVNWFNMFHYGLGSFAARER